MKSFVGEETAADRFLSAGIVSGNLPDNSRLAGEDMAKVDRLHVVLFPKVGGWTKSE